MATKRAVRPGTKIGLLQPSSFWLSFVSALLLTVTGSGGQESQLRLPAKFNVAPKGNNPNGSQKISYDDASLEITNAALDGGFVLEVQPMNAGLVAPLDSGMSNTTRGPRSGYRMLPSGTKFKTPIKLTLPFDDALLPPTSLATEIRTFFYDEKARQWKPLPLVGVDVAAGTVTSLTDHFTDFINAAVTVPDHSQVASFNPTDLKNMAGADPASGIALISPPRPTNSGGAGLSYPLEVPAARGGLQPQLSVNYGSGSGNGWMGLGWDLSSGAIAIDTRWGVPRYDPALESETYILSGSQLAPMAHRTDFVPREAEKSFHHRVEGPFERIVRHGDHPSRYWWEVTDKTGTRRFYGGDPVLNAPSPESTLTDAQGNISQWHLREIRDLNGNFCRYRHVRVEDPGLIGGQVQGSELYLQSITYTGTGAQEGPYKVTFIRDRDLGEVRRPDVPIDCRAGFKRVTADLLRKIDVSLNNQLIRRYEFRYVEGAFRKTLLASILQFGRDGMTEFNRHTFEYYDDVRTAGGAYEGFSTRTGWNTGNDNVTAGLLGNGRATAIGGASGTRIGGHLYVGFNLSSPQKEGSGGFKVGFTSSKAEGVLTLMDVNGDGLPDKVFRTDHGTFYRLNQSGPGGSTTFGPALSLPSLPAISRETSTMTSFGGEIYFFANIFTNFSNTFTKSTAYFTDVNGDGVADLVKDGQVLFAYLNQGVPAFTPNSSLTPVPVGPGAVDSTQLVEDYEAIYQQNLDTYPLQDTLRRWVAPYGGTIRIAGDVTLIQDTSAERAQYLTADGVRAAIQHNGAELWTTTIGAEDYNPKAPAGVDGIPVQAGDRIYFRVQSVFDGAYDRVAWNPEITYLNVPPVTDVNQLNPYRFKASEDFTLAGRPGISVMMPLNGTVRLAGDLAKSGPTTDDVTLLVLKNGTAIFSQTLEAAQTGSIPLNQDFSVAKQDLIQLRVKVESPIDLSRLSWAPQLFYTASPDVARVTDDNGNFILQFNPPYDIDFYPVNDLAAPQEAWTVSQNGSLTVVPHLVSNGNGDGTVTFTIKKPGQLLAKKSMVIQNGNVTGGTTTLDVTQGDVLFFDFSAVDPLLKDTLPNRSVRVFFNDPDSAINVPFGFHSEGKRGLFPVGYRQWSFTGYNGNRGRAALPVEESVLFINDTYTFETARVYPFNPVPSQGRWKGPDDSGWVSGDQFSSTRLGLKFIEVPRPSEFAGARGVSRLSRSQQTTVGAGISLLSGSSTIPPGGTSQGLVDFIDMNGDRFPDVVGNGRIQFTSPTGGLEGGNRSVPGLSKVRESLNTQANAGIGGSPAMFLGSGRGNAGVDKGPDIGSQLAPLGFSGGLGTGDYHARADLMDVNGDGLPDRVSTNGSVLTVAFNLGYGFAQPEPFADTSISEAENRNSSIGGSLGFNDGIYGWGGGISLSKSVSDSSLCLTDLNGDGLIDRVRRSGNALMVRLNTGNGFAPEVQWATGVGDGLAKNGNTGVGGGVYFTVAAGPLCLAGCYLIINPGIDLETSMSRPESMLRDVDGDGNADYVVSDSDDAMAVARNTTGRTNLLRAVRRPMGAVLSMDYARLGNTPDDPSSHWVLSRSEVHDGHAGDGADVLLSTYRYEGGRYDRREREFLGFARVFEELRNRDQGEALYRVVLQTYLNDNIYVKGLLRGERTEDDAGRPFIETENGYLLRNADTGDEPADATSLTARIFPMLTRIDRRFFEGQAVAQKSSFTTHGFDALGNVTKYFDAGDLGAQDDVEAQVTYSNFPGPYVVGKPNGIRVLSNGTLLRRRESTIDSATGNVTQVRQYLADGSFSATDLEYFPNGNLRRLTGAPNLSGQRYALDFEYDATVASQVVRITDSFGYSSISDYDFHQAKPTLVRDANSNEVRREYDQFGRLSFVTAPYEIGGTAASMAFEYHPEAAVPYAITRHLDSFRNAADPIETVVFTDGLKRMIQTKKDATLHMNPATPSQEVMSVSGATVYDFLGRVVAQRYPITEPLGMLGTFNPAVDPVAPTVMEYDVLDRKTKVTLPDGTSTSFVFGFDSDRNGVLQFATTVIDANFHPSISYRDVRGLLTATQELNVQKNQTIWMSYRHDAVRQLVEIVDNLQNTTRAEYDVLGRRTIIDNPDKGRMEQVYDLAGNVVKRITPVLRAQGKAITYQYDFNRITRILYPNFPANNITYEYGAPGAAFNRAGRLHKITDASGILERFYGKLGEVVKETRFMPIDVPGNQDADRTFTTQYTYDTFNRMQQIVYPDGEVLTYRYDSGGRLREVGGVLGAVARTYVSRLEYDKFGQKAFMALGNGTATTYNHDALNRRLAALRTARGAEAPFQNLSYTYDNVGNILQLQSQVEVPTNSMGGPTLQTFQYDSLYRLVHAEGSFTGDHQGLRTSSYTMDLDYDTIQNIQQKSQSCRVNGMVDEARSYVLNYQYQGTHPHAATKVGKRDFVYDADGNQVSYEGRDDFGSNAKVSRTIAWDEEDRMVSAGGPGNGNTPVFVYDHASQRSIKQVGAHQTAYVNSYFTIRNRDHKTLMTKHVLVGSAQIAATSFGGTLTDPHKEVSYFYYHGDHLGSSQYLTDAAGNLRQHVEYFPFGEAWVTQIRDNSDQVKDNVYFYNGKEFDAETALYYYGARYYDPRTCVWQSADPLLTTFSQDFTRRPNVKPRVEEGYCYAANNPVSKFDRQGEYSEGIHNKLLDRAFGENAAPHMRLSPEHVGLLKKGSLAADDLQYQTAAYSYRHGMRAPGESKHEAKTRLTNYVATGLMNYAAAKKAGNYEAAMDHLSGVEHAIMDQDAIMHQGFQVWHGDPRLPLAAFLTEITSLAPDRMLTGLLSVPFRLVEAIGLAILALPHFVVETITNPEPTEASMDHTVNNMQTIKKLGDDVADLGLSKDQVLYNLNTQKLIGHQEENGDK